MANGHQVINGIMLFMDNHMIPKAEGNYKVILRTAKAGMMIAPEKFWEIIKTNPLIEMVGAVKDDELDVELLAEMLKEGFDNEGFCSEFEFLGSHYKIHFDKDDVHTLKNYIVRS
jgi:hypothetical protein